LYAAGDETIAADWESQIVLLTYCKEHAASERDANRTNGSALRWAGANAARRAIIAARKNK
jgi:phosphoribosylformylglycinamidine (FGAM) synthase-like amidotransferase family enzyme